LRRFCFFSCLGFPIWLKGHPLEQVSFHTLNLVFIIGLPLSLWLYGAWKLAYGVPAFAIAFLSLPPIATVLTLGLAVFTVLAWKNKYWSVIARSSFGAASLTHYSLITLAALAFIPFLIYWNLWGFQF
jgi:hypothetical protein